MLVCEGETVAWAEGWKSVGNSLQMHFMGNVADTDLQGEVRDISTESEDGIQSRYGNCRWLNQISLGHETDAQEFNVPLPQQHVRTL